MVAGIGGRFNATLVIIIIIHAAIFATFSVPATGNGPNAQSVSEPQSETTNDVTAQIDHLIRQIDGGLIGKYIQGLQNFKTRYSYRGDKCYPASDYIASVFESNGLNVTFDEFVYSYYKMRNVIGEKRGTASPDTVFIVCAHYDSISPSSWTDAPGADDNGSGTAAVMALADLLSDYEFNCTIRFIGFCGEEQGLKGSYHYVSDMVTAGENISAVIDLDMIANNQDPGSSKVKLYTGTGTILDPSSLINETINTTVLHANPIGLEIINAGTSGGSDHLPFAPYYRSVMFIESKFSPYYHSTADTIDKLNITYCTNITQLAGATIARMAGIRPTDTSPPVLSAASPANGTYAPALPTISIEVRDPRQLNTSSFEMKVGGTSVALMLTERSLGYNVSYVPPAPFTDGQVVDVTFSASDLTGNTANLAWNFTVDAVPPEPPTEFTISASQIQPVKQNTALDIGTTYDSKYAQRPTVIHHDGEYKMWYSGYDSSRYRICYANSSDGIYWVKHGVVINNGTTLEYDSLHAAYPTVIFDGEYKMWYSGFSNSKWRVLYANSTDGIIWHKQGLALNVTLGGPDDTHAYFPCVIKTDEYKMWYTGFNGLKMHILYANSSDGLTWTKHSQEVTPDGPGIVYGDALVSDPAVVFNGTHYRMYFSRYDGLRMRTMHATSPDGLDWTEEGLALNTGEPPDYDSYRVNQCAVLLKDNETKIWYSAYNNDNMRIMYANLTDDGEGQDILLTWAPSTSADVVRYELFRESGPRYFRHPLERAFPEYYNPPAGVTPWTFERSTGKNVSVYGPMAGSDPPFFYLPEDNILDLALYMESDTGEWSKLTLSSDYVYQAGLGFVQMLPGTAEPGCTLFASYNYSAGRAMRTSGSVMSDSGAGSSTRLSYYYMIRAVDRAGNIAQCSEMFGKIGTEMLGDSWNLAGNPFLDGPTPLDEALKNLDWEMARTWDPARWPHQWTLAISGRTEPHNTLSNISQSTGVWVRVGIPNVYSACGRMSNVTINLVPGWNLVSYPYHEVKSVSSALAGISWDHVEVFSTAEPGLLMELGESDQLLPGMGLWIHTPTDSVWNAINVP